MDSTEWAELCPDVAANSGLMASSCAATSVGRHRWPILVDTRLSSLESSSLSRPTTAPNSSRTAIHVQLPGSSTETCMTVMSPMCPECRVPYPQLNSVAPVTDRPR